MAEQSVLGDRRRKAIMAQIGDKVKLLTTQVTAVAQGYTNALFVYGPGGLGKTHWITTTLEAIEGKAWVHHTAYSTPKGLMIAMTQQPDAIHLFEDCEKLYKTDVAASLLRAACGSPRQKERWVTYETAHENIRVHFRGGVIIVSNENISRTKGPLAAVASRFRPVEWTLSLEERAATILEIAESGWKKGAKSLTPEQCIEVARFLVKEMTSGRVLVPVDLRTYVEHALPAFAQWKQGESASPWQEVLLSKLQGSMDVEEKREEKTNRLRALALAISNDKDLPRERKLQAWKEGTGLGQAIYYRHLKAAKAPQIAHRKDG
jgi:hypothetical protein